MRKFLIFALILGIALLIMLAVYWNREFGKKQEATRGKKGRLIARN